MNTALWFAQGTLALVFALSGLAKSTMSKPRMAATGQTGVAHLSLPVIRFIGLSEILGALGLLLPGHLHLPPVLTPVAALCLGIIMILAARIHHRLHEPAAVAVNMVLLSLALLVATARLLHPA